MIPIPFESHEDVPVITRSDEGQIRLQEPINVQEKLSLKRGNLQKIHKTGAREYFFPRPESNKTTFECPDA